MVILKPDCAHDDPEFTAGMEHLIYHLDDDLGSFAVEDDTVLIDAPLATSEARFLALAIGIPRVEVTLHGDLQAGATVQLSRFLKPNLWKLRKTWECLRRMLTSFRPFVVPYDLGATNLTAKQMVLVV